MNIQEEYDLCVIGGGVNGAGIARDAAGRGLSVLLLEAGDLASATSSSSTKLIHGGLRYLEYCEFRMVRDSLVERSILHSLAPHIIWPQKFVLPHMPEHRPYWLIRLGLFFYDYMARRKTIKRSFAVNLRRHEYGAPLNDDLEKGFCYYDCWADDSRLVALNALDAAEHGAHIKTRTECTNIEARDDHWIIHAKAESIKFSASRPSPDSKIWLIPNSTSIFLSNALASC
jgi:glycerol-3-phosphate dehydrogenase